MPYSNDDNTDIMDKELHRLMKKADSEIAKINRLCDGLEEGDELADQEIAELEAKDSDVVFDEQSNASDEEIRT